MADGKGSVVPSTNVLNLLDGLWQFDKLMKFVYYVLCLDAFLVWNKGFGIFKLSSAMLDGFSIGDVVAFLIFFGFFSSFVLIALGFVFSTILNRVIYSDLFDFGVNDFKPLTDGYVRLSSLAKFAMETQSELAYKIYKEALDQRNKRHSSQHMAESVSVGCFLAFICGWCLSSVDASSGMIIDWLYSFEKNDMSHAGTGLFFSVFLFAYLFITYRSYNWLNSSVYYPPLYEIEENNRKKNREREKELQREFDLSMQKMNDLHRED